MTQFRCKSCGAPLEIAEGTTVVECEYCLVKQTLPKLDDDKRLNMYDRANHFRRNNEFDKAMSLYETILNEDPTDFEAYWSLVLCKYGVEYVKDPASQRYVPTINRAQYTSIYDDDNYKAALQYADSSQRMVFENDAKQINEIQKGILAISQKEEPFDVFICYKESDENGRRTHDSVIAQELYYQLKQENLKVFFARITLEDKIGSAYEPYIFAALNSAKVMVVLGSKPEYFNAVWVKNEWSRYLALIKQGEAKMLVPAYKDMDPYDLPQEFSHLQALDMTKLGFMQDLIRGIKKIVGKDKKAPVAASEMHSGNNASETAPLLRRAFLFLEDGEFDKAESYAEKVLDIDPENAEAYVVKLMVELFVIRVDDLANEKKPISSYNNYQKAIRFASEDYRKRLEGYNQMIVDRINEANLNKKYSYAMSLMANEYYKEAISEFRGIITYKDANDKIAFCEEKIRLAEEQRLKDIYESALKFMDEERYDDAIITFNTIPTYEDVPEQIAICEEKIRLAEEEAVRIAEEKARQEAEELERKKAEEARIAAAKARKAAIEKARKEEEKKIKKAETKVSNAKARKRNLIFIIAYAICIIISSLLVGIGFGILMLIPGGEDTSATVASNVGMAIFAAIFMAILDLIIQCFAALTVLPLIVFSIIKPSASRVIKIVSIIWNTLLLVGSVVFFIPILVILPPIGLIMLFSAPTLVLNEIVLIALRTKVKVHKKAGTTVAAATVATATAEAVAESSTQNEAEATTETETDVKQESEAEAEIK